MKTRIIAPEGDRKAFYTASGLIKVGPDETRSVEGLKLSDESRARLEGLGWAFEAEGVEAELDAPAQNELTPEPDTTPKRARKAKA